MRVSQSLPEGLVDKARLAGGKRQAPRQFGKRGGREQHHDAGDDEGDGRLMAGPARRLADQHVDAGADGDAEAVEHDVGQRQGTLQVRFGR